jgi:O-antigen/teichoic acid export membrane protein
MPVLTRLYDQEAFGILAIFQSVLSIAYSVGVLGYQEPIIIEKDNYKAKLIMYFCFILSLLMSILVMVVLSIPVSYFSIYKNLRIFLGIAVFLQLTNLLYNCWNIRNKQFKRNALYTVLQSISILILQFIFYRLSSYGLVYGLTLGYLSSNIYMFIKTKNEMEKPESYREVFEISKRYINFPKYFSLANLIESFSNNLPVLFLTPFFPVQTIGLYGLAHKVITHVMLSISLNIHQIIKAEMAAKRDVRPIWPVYSKMLILVIAVGGAISIIMAFFAPWLFSVFFGNEWIESGRLVRMLIPSSFGSLVKGMGNATLRVFEKTKYMLGFSIFSTLLRFASLFASYSYTKDFNLVILIYSLTTCITIISGEIYLSLCVKKHDRVLLGLEK